MSRGHEALQCPFQSIDLCAASQFSLALATALLHAARTGAPAAARVSMSSFLAWQTQTHFVTFALSPSKLEAFRPGAALLTKQAARIFGYPPGTGAVQLADGSWTMSVATGRDQAPAPNNAR